jgi:CHAT domain-containing protein
LREKTLCRLTPSRAAIDAGHSPVSKLPNAPADAPPNWFAKAEALREAKSWLRGLSREEALRRTAQLTKGVERGKGRKELPLLPQLPPSPSGAVEDRPYAHPYYWAAFVLIGDAE